MEFHNGNMIKLLEMHVDGYKGCALYSCTPAYSPDLELLHIRIASPRWFGNDLYAQERLRRPHALFTTRILQRQRARMLIRRLMNTIVTMAKCILSQLYGSELRDGCE